MLSADVPAELSGVTPLVIDAGLTFATASCAAFLAAGLADAAVYQVLRHRAPLLRMNGSNTAGALVDSLIFPTLAFGGLLPGIVVMQFAAKVAGGAVWAWVLQRKAGRA